jgi:hypothetical protein
MGSPFLPIEPTLRAFFCPFDVVIVGVGLWQKGHIAPNLIEIIISHSAQLFPIEFCG